MALFFIFSFTYKTHVLANSFSVSEIIICCCIDFGVYPMLVYRELPFLHNIQQKALVFCANPANFIENTYWTSSLTVWVPILSKNPHFLLKLWQSNFCRRHADCFRICCLGQSWWPPLSVLICQCPVFQQATHVFYLWNTIGVFVFRRADCT